MLDNTYLVGDLLVKCTRDDIKKERPVSRLVHAEEARARRGREEKLQQSEHRIAGHNRERGSSWSDCGRCVQDLPQSTD